MPPREPLACEAVPAQPDYRHLSTIAGIGIDLRYATPDNFTGRDLYSPLDCAWLHTQAATAIERARDWLAAHHADARLLILDALRPQRVQEALWQSLEGTGLRGYLADPVRGSIHSFGMAVDITLTDTAGREYDMGTPFDDLSERSHPAQEDALLAAGALTPVQIANRRILRNAMFHAGFQGINTEWWHFDCGDRQQVRATFARVL